MNLFFVLVINLVLVTGYPGWMKKNDAEYKDFPVLRVLRQVMARTSRLMHTVDIYSVKLDEQSAYFVKQMIIEGRSDSLKNIRMDEVDNFFNMASQNNVDVLNFTAINLNICGKDLLMMDTTQWSVHNNIRNKQKTLSKDNFYLMKARRPVLKSEDFGVYFEFILGTFYEQVEVSNMEYFFGNMDKQFRTFILSDPTLEFSTRGEKECIEYSLILHASQISGHSMLLTSNEQKKRTVLNLIRGISEIISGKVENPIPVINRIAYQRSSKDYRTSLDHSKTELFIKRWIEVVSPIHVIVNLNGAAKFFLENYPVLGSYITKRDIPFDCDEVDEGVEDRLPFEDKFPSDKNQFGFVLSQQTPSDNNVGRELQASLDKRISLIQKVLKEKGISDQNLNKWEKWLKKMMKSDFRSYRKRYGITNKFRQTSNDFSVHKKTETVRVKGNDAEFPETVQGVKGSDRSPLGMVKPSHNIPGEVEILLEIVGANTKDKNRGDAPVKMVAGSDSEESPLCEPDEYDVESITDFIPAPEENWGDAAEFPPAPDENWVAAPVKVVDGSDLEESPPCEPDEYDVESITDFIPAPEENWGDAPKYPPAPGKNWVDVSIMRGVGSDTEDSSSSESDECDVEPITDFIPAPDENWGVFPVKEVAGSDWEESLPCEPDEYDVESKTHFIPALEENWGDTLEFPPAPDDENCEDYYEK